MINSELSQILIVDDELINIEVLKGLLENEYKVTCARSGQHALELAKELHPDLILLDVMMPVMDGYKVCEQLKADSNTASIPVIFITGLSDPRAEIKGLQVGAIDYVTKPINPPVLQMRVRNHIELQKARNKLKYLSVTDGLTNLANRRRFDEVLENEFYRLSRLQHPLSLIMLDIDFFKLFNDSYGHVVGDDCLKQTAYTIDRSLRRPADFAARYGGEEFACILPSTDLPGALEVAENIRSGIEALNIPHHSSLICDHVTASLGVFTIYSYSEISHDNLIMKVDKQLYRAKENGRNRICFDQIAENVD